MSHVQRLYEITKALYKLVECQLSEKERDNVIEKMTKYLAVRDELIQDLKPPYNDEEMELGTEILKMNTFIESQFDKLKQEIQQDIQKIKKKKQSQKKYNNPYKSVETSDGIFYDKRK